MKIKRLLKKISKDEGFSLILGNSLLSVFSFLILIILSHNLSIGIYGKLREILLYSGLIIQFSTAGFSQTIYYYLNVKACLEERKLIVKQVRIFQIILLCTSVSILAFILTTYLSNESKLSLIDWLSIITYIFFSGLSVIDLNLALVYGKYVRYIKYNIIIQAGRCILLLVLTSFSMNLTYILVLNAVMQAIIGLANWAVLKDDFFGAKSWNFDLNLQKTLISYALPLFFSSISSFLIANTGKFIVSLESNNLANFAVFANVTFDVPFLANIYISYFTIALPAMIMAYQNKNDGEVIQLRFKYILKVVNVIFPVSIAVVVWHKDFIGLFFGNSYVQYSYLFAIYSLVGLLRVCSHHDILLATNRTKFIFYFQFAELIFHVLLSLVLYKYLGVLGLVFAVVITSYLYVILVNIYSAQILNVSILKLFPYLTIFKDLVVFGISAFALQRIFDYFTPTFSFYISITIWFLFVLLIKKQSIEKYLTDNS
ncbi:MATE family efflux transporter [Pedobacter arcticus]|uniref:hypothetical protein n=1 Tax=Pedobacter arcticus TaxID=752140 RepID=UPI00031F69B7|nr:hypothetical protein [Pedobacter arcticus]